MDITTHSVTLISIIIGIGLTEMFGNLHRLIRNPTQVTWDWLPVAWSAVLLVVVGGQLLVGDLLRHHRHKPAEQCR